jgi:lysozyme family protein
VLLLRLINAVPDALERLQANKTAIHRPWSQWIDFAQGAVDVLKTVRAASQALQSQAAAESAKLAMAQTAPPSITQDARALANSNIAQQPSSQQATPVAGTSRVASPVVSAGGLKIISISSKVIATKPKAAQLRSVSHSKKKKKA